MYEKLIFMHEYIYIFHLNYLCTYMRAMTVYVLTEQIVIYIYVKDNLLLNIQYQH